jgi:hypothetical protein
MWDSNQMKKTYCASNQSRNVASFDLLFSRGERSLDIGHIHDAFGLLQSAHGHLSQRSGIQLRTTELLFDFLHLQRKEEALDVETQTRLGRRTSKQSLWWYTTQPTHLVKGVVNPANERNNTSFVAPSLVVSIFVL